MTSASDRGLDTKNVRALVSGYGVGLFLGALLAIAVAGAGFMLFGALHALPLIIAVCAAIGLCDGLVWVGYVSFRAQIVPGEFLGRVSSVSQTLSMGLSPLGLMAAGVALDRVGGDGTLLGMGALSRASRGARVYGDEARRVNRQDAKEDAKDAKTRRVESGEKRDGPAGRR